MIALLAAAAVAQSLPEVQQKLADERAAAQRLADRESSLLGRLADIERQVEVEGRAYRAAQARLRAATARFEKVESRAKETQAQVDEATDIVGPRLVARYKLGREGYVRFLLGAKSVSDLLKRRRLYDALLEADLDALAMLRFEAQGAKAARDELASAQDELTAAVAAESEKRKALDDRAAQQKRLLASVQQERAVHEQAVRELEEAERELTQKVGELAAKAPAMVAPEITLKASIRKARGRLPFPVALGKVEVRFGRAVDKRFNTVTLQQGIDVRAPQGTPVHAVWDGKVAHAGWFKGFGNLLIIDHGDRIFSLMAHLDSLEKAVGDEVHQGDEVGTVGDTGSLKGAYLYFELRDGQKPLDPGRWLSRVRKGPALLAGAKGGAAK
ncbi:MAG TPA: peptidoglycan DD-metalloendopeptidase family protein [Myxococcales bacterium]|nr:peptidoglycan DD-metalloendopeptidase family protein [Myxococcales bacterium]